MMDFIGILLKLEEKKPVVVCGDLNVAHQEIDLKNPKSNRIDLTPETDVDAILAKVKEMYKDEEVNDIDGVKIDFPD